MTTSIETPPPRPSRSVLIRDAAALQVKLIVDGLRDFLLVPVSMGAGILSLLRSGENGVGTEFYDLLQYGRRTERVINLFGAASRVHASPNEEPTVPDIDDMLEQVESFVVNEYRQGGVPAQAKKRIEAILRKLAESRSANS